MLLDVIYFVPLRLSYMGPRNSLTNFSEVEALEDLDSLIETPFEEYGWLDVGLSR